MIKLIASDLDGTLLQNGAQELDPIIFDQIRTLKENGIRFAAAGGRQYPNLRRLFAPVQDHISYIAENGSLCVHDGKVLSRGLIPRDLGNRIVDAIHQCSGCECIISGEKVCYSDSVNEEFRYHMLHVMKNDMKFVDSIDEIQEPYLKIAVCNFNGTKDCLAYFQKLFSSEIKVVTSGNIWVDFIAPDANKGTALHTLLDYLHILPEECVAFGDQYNDVEMLQLAGTSYAMSGAAPGISFYSTYVTNSVSDVLSDIIASTSI